MISAFKKKEDDLMNKKFSLRAINQVGIVVKDLEKTIKNYWDLFGIGPWSIYTATPPDLTDTTFYGKSQKYSMKLAHTKVGSTMLEIIQPLEGKSIYREFLEKKGEGIHHIACYEVDDLDMTISELINRGVDIIQTGKWKGAYFAYLDTEDMLGTIVEIVTRSSDFPPPDTTYP
jgi:methylmalonyl-CoA epimerase